MVVRSPYTERVFGISGAEFFVIILVAVIVVGPQRLPEYTRQLTRMVRQLRLFLDNARSQIAEEVGPELAELDLSSLDPRQYDPRKIVREALGEDIEAIRKDLTQPFRSVADAAKETSEGAAKAVNDAVKQDRANSLSKQISKKKAEAQAVSAASAAGAAAVGAGGAAAAAASGRAASAEDEAPAAEEAQAPQTAESLADPVAEGRQEMPGDAAEEAVAEETTAAEDTEAAEGTEDTEAAEDTESTNGAGAAEGVDAVAEEQPAEAAVVPSSLEPAASGDEDSQPTDASGKAGPAQPLRPLSPRDIVRAANDAARTRTEAAGTRL